MGSIVLGNGSNDVLELVALAFLGPGRAAVFSQHCFAVYPLATQARGARSIVVPAKNYGHDLEAMATAIDDETYVVVDRQPEQPDRHLRAPRRDRGVPARACRSACWWCSTRPTTSTCRRAARPTRVKLLKRHPNLVDHAHLLQGLRPRRPARRLRARASVGRRHHEPRAPAVQREQPRAGRGGARRSTTWSSSRAATPRTCRACAQLEEGARALGLDYIPSHGNFITVRVGKAPEIYKRLLRRGVIVRPVGGGYGLPEHLRVTIGTAAGERAVPRARSPRSLKE